MLRAVVILLFFSMTSTCFCQKKYQKEYFNDGTLKAEGWVKDSLKDGYWTFYHPNGNKEKEGHFTNGVANKYWYFYREEGSKEREGHYKNGKRQKWWLYFDENGFVNHKCQLKNDKKNGYCFMYENKKLIKAVKYQNGKKIKEWTDYSSFRRENKLSDLK